MSKVTRSTANNLRNIKQLLNVSKSSELVQVQNIVSLNMKLNVTSADHQMVNESSVEKFDIPNQDQIVKVDLSHISKMTRLKTICLKASRRDPQTANKSFVKLSDMHNHKDKIVKFELSHDKPAVPFSVHRTEFPIFKKLAFYQAPIN